MVFILCGLGDTEKKNNPHTAHYRCISSHVALVRVQLDSRMQSLWLWRASGINTQSHIRYLYIFLFNMHSLLINSESSPYSSIHQM